MKHHLVTLLVLLAAGVFSCTGSKPPAGAEGGSPLSAAGGAQPAPPAVVGGAHPTTSVQSFPEAPKDAQWTLYCYVATGPGHADSARRLKEAAQRATGLTNWYIIHSAQESTLYYGFYRSFNDPRDRRESERAQRDRQAVSAAVVGGDLPFSHAMFVELETSDPPAPAEWNLVNAQGYWSLQIAAYTGSTERKLAAVEAVRAAREMGIEAYFFHGPTVSSVCIGAWPADAVKAQDAAEEDVGRIARAGGADQDVMVIDIPGAHNLLKGRQQRDDLVIMAPVIEPQDPTMIRAMQQYPHHSINGEWEMKVRTDPRTRQRTREHVPTALVVIPNATATDPIAEVGQEPPVPIFRPGGSTTPGGGAGRLRSFGE